jgi:hypothetical protein
VVGLLATTLLCAAAMGGSVQDAAQEVCDGASAGDAAAFEELAARANPDPWRVADELCADGEVDLAARFATAAPQELNSGLAAYVETRREHRVAQEVRDRFPRIAEPWSDEDWAGVLAATDGFDGPADTVPAIRLYVARGYALTKLERHADAAEAFVTGARGAHAIGWRVKASDTFRDVSDACIANDDG